MMPLNPVKAAQLQLLFCLKVHEKCKKKLTLLQSVVKTHPNFLHLFIPNCGKNRCLPVMNVQMLPTFLLLWTFDDLRIAQ